MARELLKGMTSLLKGSGKAAVRQSNAVTRQAPKRAPAAWLDYLATTRHTAREKWLLKHSKERKEQFHTSAVTGADAY